MKPDGLPAFPTTHYGEVRPTAHTEGMSLRDYFAGQTLAGLLADPNVCGPAKVASACYKYADAMLAERAR